MIYLVSGPPGNGKSYKAIREIRQALEQGKVVAGNVQLAPNWPEKMARHSWPLWIRRFKRRHFIAHAADRYHYSEDLSELASLRVCFCGADPDDPDDWCKCREGRALMVLDEGHNWMNARSWSAEDRKEIVRFFSQHRKHGWDILLIAQHPEMIDKQVRNLVEYNVFMRNLKKARWGGIPIFPINLFLSVWCWHSANRVVIKRQMMRLGWEKNLYDTNALSHGEGGGEGRRLIWLPSPPATRVVEQAAPQARPDGRTDAERPRARPDAPPDASAPDLAGAGLGVPGEEASAEAGEPEAWPVDGDFRRI